MLNQAKSAQETAALQGRGRWLEQDSRAQGGGQQQADQVELQLEDTPGTVGVASDKSRTAPCRN